MNDDVKRLPTPTQLARAVAVFSGAFNAHRDPVDRTESAMLEALTDFVAGRAGLEAVEDVKRLRAALEQIAKGRGPYSRDELKFAQNVIAAARATACTALGVPNEPSPDAARSAVPATETAMQDVTGNPIEEAIAALEGGPTVADAAKPLALRVLNAISILKLHALSRDAEGPRDEVRGEEPTTPEDADASIREAYYDHMRAPLLFFFGTTDPDLLTEVWRDQAEARERAHGPRVQAKQILDEESMPFLPDPCPCWDSLPCDLHDGVQRSVDAEGPRDAVTDAEIRRAISDYSKAFLANRPEQHGRPMTAKSHDDANDAAFRAVLENFVRARSGRASPSGEDRA